MLQKLLTKLLLFGYDTAHLGKLTRYEAAIAFANKKEHVFDRVKLYEYLKKFQINELLETLPVLTKDIFKKNVDKVVNKRGFSFVYTGGSTGEPLKIPLSKRRALIRTASIKYYNSIGNFKAGDRFLFIKEKKKSPLLEFLRNEILFIPYRLSCADVEFLARKMVEKRVEAIIGFPSVMYSLAQFFDNEKQQRKQLMVKSLISVSEPIDQQKREFIYKIFRCPFVDRYSSEEVGVIAHQYEFGGDYLVDRYGVYVELLNPVSLEPVPEGGRGRVYVTDVNADIVPVIRYDTGDDAIAGSYMKNQLYSIRHIIGRTSDSLYTTKGDLVSSLSLGPKIHQPFSEQGIHTQFQLAQVGNTRFELRLRQSDHQSLNEAVKQVIRNLQPIFGDNADFETKIMNEIPCSPSGKRPLYVNEIKTNG